MFFHEHDSAPRSTHWVYDDPSGVPEGPASLSACLSRFAGRSSSQPRARVSRLPSGSPRPFAAPSAPQSSASI